MTELTCYALRRGSAALFFRFHLNNNPWGGRIRYLIMRGCYQKVTGESSGLGPVAGEKTGAKCDRLPTVFSLGSAPFWDYVVYGWWLMDEDNHKGLDGLPIAIIGGRNAHQFFFNQGSTRHEIR